MFFLTLIDADGATIASLRGNDIRIASEEDVQLAEKHVQPVNSLLFLVW